MSIFRPHKLKPRQFNYTPRYYDPEKEAREQRRRELHGTSLENDAEEYVPGNYLRTQRDARNVARAERQHAQTNKLLRAAVLLALIGLGMVMLYPRIMLFIERVMQEPQAVESIEVLDSVDMSKKIYIRPTVIEDVVELEDIEDKELFKRNLEEMAEWNQRTRSVTIYDNDVEIVDGKRIEE